MRKRRRARYNWMPTLGTGIATDAGAYSANWFQINSLRPNASNAIAPVNVVFPLVPDFTQFERDAAGNPTGANLQDQVRGNSWLIKRIVGKIELYTTLGTVTNGVDPGTVWSKILVTMGLFVARAADTNQGIPGMFAFEYDPQALDNVRNPWLFRRTWLLDSQFFDTADSQIKTHDLSSQFNTYTGSVAEGSHIDSKVARRVMSEQRLWCVLQVQGGDADNVDVSGTGATQAGVAGFIDLRILGALRSDRNRSQF